MAGEEQARWYFATGGQQHGPVDWLALAQMARAGQLSPYDLVWTEGMANWTPAGRVDGLIPTGGGVAAPATTPAANPASPAGMASSRDARPLQPPMAPAGTPVPISYYRPLQRTSLQYAGFWLRFVAWILDIIVVNVAGLIVGLIVGFAIGLAMASSGSGTQQIEKVAGGVGQLLSIVIAWLYWAIMESSPTQATLGKMALGLKVTDVDVQRLSFGRATGRYFAKILSALILFFGFFMAGWTERKQALHDLIANTLVIRK